MAARIRAFDWSRTALGPTGGWSAALRASVQLMLDSGLPMMIGWGDDLLQIYNDAAIPLAGPAHPAALGTALRNSWPEAWRMQRPLFDGVLGGATTVADDLRVTLERAGRSETASFRGSFSPLREEGGEIAGVVAMVQETTETLPARKVQEALAARQDFLLRLSDALRPLTDPDAIETAAARLLAAHLDAAHMDGADDAALVAEANERTRSAAERARAQALLRRSNQRYRALVIAGTYSIYRMSPDWRFMYRLDSDTLANTAAPIENWVDKYIPDEDRPGVFAAIAEAIRSKSLFELEHRVRTADGGIAWVLSRAVPLLDKHGAIVEWFGVGSDVTERRMATEALHRRDARRRAELERQVRDRTRELEQGRDLLQATMDSSHDLIQVFAAIRDADGRIVDFRWVLNNRASERLVGEVRGESLLQRNPGVVEAGIFDAFCRVVETGLPDQSERHYAHEQFDGWFYQSVVKLGDGVATTTKDITEWKAGQAALMRLRDQVTSARLQESEARLAAVFQVLPMGLHVADRDGRTVLTNVELQRFMPNGVIPSRDPDRVWRWRAWDEAGDPVPAEQFPGARALRGEAVVPGMEMLYSHDDGSEIWTSVSSLPIRGEDGEITGQVGVIIDIDTTKRSAEALRESEDRLRQFGEASQDILWIRDAKTLQWTYLTPAFETIYGQPRDAALSGDNYRSWLDLVVPEDRDGVIAALARVCAGEHVTFDYRIRRLSDGAIRWLRDADFPIRGKGGVVTGIGGIGKDITDAKLAQEVIARSEERLRSAVEVGKLGLWDWNVRTGEMHWSDEHFHMGGYAAGEIVPDYDLWIAALHPDDRSATEAALHRAMDEHGDYAREFRLRHRDGSVRWLYGRGRFFYDRAGRPQRMIGAVIDVTDRREWEERQQVLIAELQHRTRNLLAMVRSIAEKTVHSSTGMDDFRDRFRDRLDALARVQGLLSRLDEHDRVNFDELIHSEVAAMNGSGERVLLDGPAGIRLRSSTVQMLAMALHELATNAVKYGALGQPDGRLSIRWRLEPDGQRGLPWLHIDWRETGVDMTRSAAGTGGSGQGRELIEHALPYQLNARTSYAFEPDGVHCAISVPVSATRAAEAEHG